MVFPYTVKHNGVYYPAGTDVPVEGKPKAEPKVEDEPKAEPKQKTESKKPFKK